MKAMDIGGKSDPFVVITFGPTSFRTAVRPNTLDPVWNQVFSCHVCDWCGSCGWWWQGGEVLTPRMHVNQECRLPVHTFSRHYKIILSVYDFDRVSENDFIGRVELDLDRYEHVFAGKRDELYLDVKDETGKPSGRLHVKLAWSPRQGS